MITNPRSTPDFQKTWLDTDGHHQDIMSTPRLSSSPSPSCTTTTSTTTTSSSSSSSTSSPPTPTTPYPSPRPLTPSGFDPVAAIHRQHAFAAHMHAARWLTATPHADALLAHAVARYARFLALAAAHPRLGLAPALDVDLAWHTHLLRGPRRYAAGCRAAAVHPLDHDDTLPEEDLAASGDAAARLYRARFDGAPYDLCHCAPCVVDRFGGGGGGDGVDGGCAGDDELSGPPKCQRKCQAACQNRCGRRCGYVCGACEKPPN